MVSLNKSQNRFINAKFNGTVFLKGKKNTGKTTAAIYRAMNLSNNYCLFNNDKVLFLSDNTIDVKANENKYNDLKSTNDFYSLFSFQNNKVKFDTISSILPTYLNTYDSLNEKEAISLLNSKEIVEILNVAKIKFKSLKDLSMETLKIEIDFIRSSMYSLNEYLTCKRYNTKLILRKNSKARAIMYKIKELYEDLLLKNNKKDYISNVLYINENHSCVKEKFTHIIVDFKNEPSKMELDLIEKLYNKTSYSSLVFILEDTFSRDFKNSLVFSSTKKKNFNFKVEFNEVLHTIDTFVDEFKYINLKNKREVSFNTDSYSAEREVFIKEDNILFNNNELLDIPIFNEIAAGNPIEINDEFQENFSLPKAWVGKGKELFILKVKGNSMIEKNIFNDDLVVIQKQSTAYHNDVVAASLDGEATLKTLNLNGEYPSLVPANILYSPIDLKNRNVSILGIVIGIIKQ